MKPTLNLYMRWIVTGVYQDAALSWQWAIELTEPKNEKRKTLIVNRSRRETIAPIEILDGKLEAVSMSLSDTTLSFMMPNGYVQKVGLNPTQYAISDPEHGGLSYPQWPEELEEAGVTAHPDDDPSAKPSETWQDERERLTKAQHLRQDNEQREWIQEDENEN